MHLHGSEKSSDETEKPILGSWGTNVTVALYGRHRGRRSEPSSDSSAASLPDHQL